jgi:hypothetical protein
VFTGLDLYERVEAEVEAQADNSGIVVPAHLFGALVNSALRGVNNKVAIYFRRRKGRTTAGKRYRIWRDPIRRICRASIDGEPLKIERRLQFPGVANSETYDSTLGGVVACWMETDTRNQLRLVGFDNLPGSNEVVHYILNETPPRFTDAAEPMPCEPEAEDALFHHVMVSLSRTENFHMKQYYSDYLALLLQDIESLSTLVDRVVYSQGQVGDSFISEDDPGMHY